MEFIDFLRQMDRMCERTDHCRNCPLRAAICYGDSCAWYMQGCRRCALLVLGEAGEIATTTAIIIPK